VAIELLYERTPGEEEVREAMALPAEGLELPVFRLGRGYAWLMEKGYAQAAIAGAVGKSQTHVSLAARIYRGLCPQAHLMLCRLGSAAPDVLKIGKIAGLEDPVVQVEAVQSIVCKNPVAPVMERFLLLRERALTFPKGIEFEIVRAVLGYLAGETEDLWPSTTETRKAPRRRTSRSRSTS
jgi:hypothetical protein